MKHLFVFWLTAVLFMSANSCSDAKTVTPEVKDPKKKIELLMPDDGIDLDLGELESVSFEWKQEEGINAYKVLVSRSRGMSSPVEFASLSNPLVINASDFDSALAGLGIPEDAVSALYWAVIPWGNDSVDMSESRKMTVARKPGEVIPYEKRIADPIAVKVAILIEDPVVPGTDGKRIHEVCTTPGYSYPWNDPWEQAVKFESDLEEASHGVVQYEVVKTIDADRFFSYNSTVLSDEKRYLTIDTLVNHIFKDGPVPGIGSGVEYDYVGMIRHYGFDKMRDSGEIDEVWVYTHPGSGMYESRLIGKGAFWLNSPGISTGAPCENLLTVMFCNYERTVDLALHSYGHRFESIMNQVYGQWNYTGKTRKSELTNWERYSAYNINYEKFESGHAHVGNVHFPPNAANDYDYSNRNYVYTYADSWYDYPDVKDVSPRRVNCSEWGNDQQGYMMWYFGHMPHFKGLNEDVNDLHLNNWWHYVVDYNAARRYERELQGGM